MFVSTATTWEIRIRQRMGKLDLPAQFDAALDASSFHWLPASRAYADCRAQFPFHLPFHHRDPFNRMLIAQAHCEDFTLLTVNERLAAHGKNVCWTGYSELDPPAHRFLCLRLNRHLAMPAAKLEAGMARYIPSCGALYTLRRLIPGALPDRLSIFVLILPEMAKERIPHQAILTDDRRRSLSG